MTGHQRWKWRFFADYEKPQIDRLLAAWGTWPAKGNHRLYAEATNLAEGGEWVRTNASWATLAEVCRNAGIRVRRKEWIW